ncbi:DUF3536 domain-containing protein [Desulfonatronovibrio hydrogenovorans]|uniref:DUF3536 domain-containing protein n=1 Tax=Desulfonatronovibrio hydrogenovorans TaxID=53245 RepID=UPI00068B2823|nr:DUF3536 domain-containing protein [Desulfonatronovibrio hydrogenovorans]
MSSKLCIHGHFYQPPRFDPWLEEVLPEASAAPFSNWNQRISRECYTPLAFARRVDDNGFIFNMINCYEYISYNFGPTILAWMEEHSPETYARVIEGDKKGLARFGQGNAMAQVYHHVIMPLSTDQDRDIEIHWSILDFEHRYGRKPDGMWLAETAVCTDTLEALARAGIKYTVLAPRQADAVSGLDQENWISIEENGLDTTRPYLVRLPSGKEISLFFYDGSLSQAVAFEELLRDGRGFLDRILSRKDAPLLSLATDGESYGHHFKFGEMALAYVLEELHKDDSPMGLTNYASYLEQHPPEYQVRIREKTSWSCIHGVERWREDCGCKDGGHPHWNQRWRKPLRRALNLLKYYIDAHYRRAGREVFRDENLALRHYGSCLCNALDRDTFLDEHQKGKLTARDRTRALKLLEMQRMGLASFSSCAWFFDDIGRIEPLNGLGHALKGLDLLRDLGGPDVEGEFLEVLEEAYSNEEKVGDGRKLWSELVRPRRMTPGKMALTAAALREDDSISFPGLEFRLSEQKDELQLDYQWKSTLEQGRVSFKQPRSSKGYDYPEIDDGQGSIISMADLDKRLRDFILCRFEHRLERSLWELELELPGFIRDQLMCPFEQGQKAPLAGAGVQSAGTVFQYLLSGGRCADFEDFWSRVVRDNPFFRQIMEKRITDELDSLTTGSDPDWDRAGQLMHGSRNMGLFPDIFYLQNRLWEDGKGDVQKEILEKFYIRKAGEDE